MRKDLVWGKKYGPAVLRDVRYMKVILLNEKAKFLFFFYKPFFNSFIYLFMAVLGLSRCCAGFSPVVASEGHSVAVVHGFLMAVASLVSDHKL